jgi:hypothetical protein
MIVVVRASAVVTSATSAFVLSAAAVIMRVVVCALSPASTLRCPSSSGADSPRILTGGRLL